MRHVLLLVLLAASPVALAHPEDAAGGFWHGFTHPFAGLDHLLAMIAIGLWAARFSGMPRWILPAAFVSFMAIGAALGDRIELPLVEPMIALSVLVIGLAVAIAVRLPVALGAAVAALFALYHGHAHFAEMPADTSVLGFAVGMLSATALLHAADAFVQEKKLAARVAVPECPIAGLPDRAGCGLAVDHDLWNCLRGVDAGRQRCRRRLAGTRRRGRRRRLAVPLRVATRHRHREHGRGHSKRQQNSSHVWPSFCARLSTARGKYEREISQPAHITLHLALTPGTRLGVYEITAPIGEGGKGQVFRATDTKLKRQVAIKILPPPLAADQDRLARFQREEVLASLNHPHIAKLESTLAERWFEQGLDRLLEFRQFLLDDTPPTISRFTPK
jgi:urease accessory protein